MIQSYPAIVNPDYNDSLAIANFHSGPNSFPVRIIHCYKHTVIVPLHKNQKSF